MAWKVVRQNKDGSETEVIATLSESEAKAMASKLNTDEGLGDESAYQPPDLPGG